METQTCAPGEPGVRPSPPVRTLAVDEVVAGRYQVVRFIAEGAMGEVYEVQDRTLRARVALKLIRPERASQSGASERFARELLLARRVTHPNVCRVFDLGRHDQADPEGAAQEVMFLTMELLEGWTLREYLATRGRLPPDEVLKLAGQLAAGLDAAHAAQVIHRDFKSRNVVLVPAPGQPGTLRAVVTDFGLARGESSEDDPSVSREGVFLGSPGYMSPEQVLCQPVTSATDVYSFGVVLFELLTGRLPFVGEGPVEAIVRRLHEPPPAPSTLVPGLAPVWDEVLLRCMALAPEGRFATASEAVATLERGGAHVLHSGPAGPQGPSASLPGGAGSRERLEPQGPEAVLPGGEGGRARELHPAEHGARPGGEEESTLTLHPPGLQGALPGGESARTRERHRPAERVPPGGRGDGAREIRWLGPPEGRRPKVALVLGALVLVGVGAALPGRLPSRGEGVPERPAPEAQTSKERAASIRGARRSVAVLAPRNLSAQPDAAWLSTALAEMLSAELAGGSVRVLSGESVARMGRELGLPEGESLAADTLRRVRAHSGADLVLTGAYLLVAQEGGAALRLDLRLQEAGSGETVAHVTDTGTEKDLLPLVSRVGGALRAQLGMAPLTTEQVLGVRSTLPVNPNAVRLYAEGLAALRGWNAATAVQRLEQVVALEPRFAPAHSALASAFKQLFLVGREREAARRAYELAGSLPREERLLVEARHHAASANWNPALDAYRTLFEFFPDNLEYGLELVAAQVSAGHHHDALDTLEALRRLPPPQGEDARIDYTAALATAATGDFAATQRHAGSAVARARETGQHMVMAHALTYEAFALRNLGEPERALELMEASERLFQAAGNRGGAAWAMLTRAIVLSDRVRLHDAAAVYAAALRAGQKFRGSLLEAESLLNMGWVRCHLGDQDEALRLTEQTRALYQQLGLQTDLLATTIQLGMVRRFRGELDAAQRLLEASAEEARAPLEDDYNEAWARYELGHLLLDRGQPEQARAQLERALALRKERGLGVFVAETELALARLALAEGKPQEALLRAEAARAAYAAQRTADKEGLARAMMARAQLAQGDTAGARAAMAQARTLAGDSESIFIAAEVARTAAWVAVYGGGTPEDRREAAHRLEALVEKATAGGTPGVALEARLAALELAWAEGTPFRTQLQALEAEARQLGYEDLARRAGKLARH